jgi:AraC-like DNA-binding protein
MKKIINVIIVCITLLMCGCKHPVPQPQPRTDRYSVDTLRRLAARDLDLAYQRVDEGEQNGDLSLYESANLRANLTYQYTDNYPMAMDYCRQALSALSDDDYANKVQTYYLFATIAEMGKDFTACINACSEGKAIAHKHKLRFKEYSFDYIVGKCKLDMGSQDEGIALMSESIDKAAKIVEVESDYGHLIFFVNNMMSCYLSVGDMKNVLREADIMQRLVDDMELKYPHARPYCEQCRFYILSQRAIAKASIGSLTEAENDFKEALKYSFANSYHGSQNKLEYYAVTGNVDSVLNIMERYPYQDADTIKRRYRMRLATYEKVYRTSGDTTMADHYKTRIDSLTTLIDNRERQEGTAINAAQYETQQYKMELDELSKNTRLAMMILFLIVVTVIPTFIIFHRVNKRKISKSSEKLEQIQKQVRIMAGENNATQSLVTFIEGQKLYLNKDISRALVTQMMGCSHKTLTKMLNDIHPDLSFPDYIKGLRIAHALKLIQENRYLTITQIADQSGFYSISSFERSFKSITGKTPKEFMKSLSN